ncbi:high chlorophyll fluorescence [Thalictrum thalictroides]|uniref:High chlorophyll fluorescence n=1 Tax=Thalictrum thalictroides TaxID=46969 RepID=A0A7J6WNL7_THATH|nr:high chlorophyll fluorescence [Thalictrum thalictroides]
MATTINNPISSSFLFSTNYNTIRIQTHTRIRSIAINQSTQPSLTSFLSPASNGFEKGKKKRGLEVVTRAGLSSTNLIFAFVMPITLVLVTVFTSIKIADKLDEDFMEELAKNEAIMQGEGMDEGTSTLADEKSAAPTWEQEKSAVPRIRNRPKREAEV